ATTLVRWTRIRRGWRDCGVVIADDLDLAERRFFDSRTALRAAAKPAPMVAAGQIPAAQVGSAHPDIVGLFPEPGGGRGAAPLSTTAAASCIRPPRHLNGQYARAARHSRLR